MPSSGLDNSFSEWLKEVAPPELQCWDDQLIELGVSWHSFQHRQPDDLVKDLVANGIPLIPSRDIVSLVSKELDRKLAPMAIFWDMENVPIPGNRSGQEVASRLKSVLANHGTLIQFRGYASIAMRYIPEHKRSDLHLSGLHLIDCPHNGRKEVADKMIIVDAMQFAYSHPDGATLCFITGDLDYAYLLAVFQQRPQWRTIVISKGRLRSMLEINCDVRFCWETDVLSLNTPMAVREESSDNLTNAQLLRGVLDNPLPGGGEHFVPKSSLGSKLRNTHPDRFPHRDSVRVYLAEVIDSGELVERGTGTRKTVGLPKLSDNIAEKASGPIAVSKKCDQDREILRGIIGSGSVSKGDVSMALKREYPARFCKRNAVKKFLTWAIKNGIVIERGTRNDKMLCLPSTNETKPKAPLPSNDFNNNDALRLLRSVTKENLPQTHKDISRALQSKHSVRFPTKKEVKCFMDNAIKGGVLKWTNEVKGKSLLRLQNDTACPSSSQTSSSSSPPTVKNGSDCRDGNSEETFAALKESEVSQVVEVVRIMAMNDDVYIAEDVLRGHLQWRWPDECSSLSIGSRWIREAVDKKKLARFHDQGSKNAFLCLPSNLAASVASVAKPANMNTSTEERYVKDLLRKKGNWIRRSTLTLHLIEKFETMKEPWMRRKLYTNAEAKGSFFVAKRHYSQTVGLTKRAAEAGLDLLEPEDMPRPNPKLGPRLAAKQETCNVSLVSTKPTGEERDGRHDLGVSNPLLAAKQETCNVSNVSAKPMREERDGLHDLAVSNRDNASSSLQVGCESTDVGPSSWYFL
jgi:hypothetical protein